MNPVLGVGGGTLPRPPVRRQKTFVMETSRQGLKDYNACVRKLTIAT